MKLGVFIPGRLQSQRLPNKLILPLGDSCLWEIACKKLSELPSKYEKAVLCSDKELIDIAQRYRVPVIVRDEDTTKADGPLNFVFKDIRNMSATHLMFLNPCLPLLSTDTIVSALEYAEKSNWDYMESVIPFKNWVFDSFGMPVNNMNYRRLSTKELETWYMDANAFRVFNKDAFLEDGMMLKPNHAIFKIPLKEAVDVDTKEDFEIVECMVRK